MANDSYFRFDDYDDKMNAYILTIQSSNKKWLSWKHKVPYWLKIAVRIDLIPGTQST